MLRPRLTPALHEGSRPLGRHGTPAVVRRGPMSAIVFCWCQCLRYELVGDHHSDRAGGRDRPIREQAIDRNNSSQDISRLVDSDG
jgi:hypothetical protein